MMHVLIITHIFWPEITDFKNLPLAKALVKHGHKVTVLTAFPNYPLGRIYDGYKQTWRQWEEVDGVRILRVPIYVDHSSSGFKRILNYCSLTISASIIGPLLTGKVDVVFVYSPPMTLGVTAGIFKLIHHTPVVLDVLDLWPEAISGSGMTRSTIVIKGAEWIARIAYWIADKITVPTAGYALRLESLGVQKEKVNIVPIWADGSIYYKSDRNIEFGEKHNLVGKFCIIHAGNIGSFQDINNVILAAERLRNNKDLRIILVGGGTDLASLKRYVESRNLDIVIFAGRYPVDKMSGIFAWADALLVSLRKDPYLDINFPSKVAAYLASGRPIIACAEGETCRLISDFQLGMQCCPGNPDELAETFVQFMKLPLKIREEMGQRGRQVFESFYDKDILIQKYIFMLEELAGKVKGHTQ